MVTRALYRTRVVMIEREREKVAINRPKVFRNGGYKVRTETDNFTKIGSTEKNQKPDKIAGCHASPVSVSCEQGKRCVRRIFPCRRFSINSPIFPSNLIVLDCFQQHRERAIKNPDNHLYESYAIFFLWSKMNLFYAFLIFHIKVICKLFRAVFDSMRSFYIMLKRKVFWHLKNRADKCFSHMIWHKMIQAFLKPLKIYKSAICTI